MIVIKFQLLLVFLTTRTTSTVNEDYQYWYKLAKDDIEHGFKNRINTNLAKNVILFVGDGMGLTTITTARIYSKTERGYLSFEKFPHIGVLKTYSADKLVPDSCSTATALFCGVKANFRTSGVDATVKIDDCQRSLDNHTHLKSILKWAQDSNKSTGFVTTTRVTHATPSALYAHTPNRKWECENTIPLGSRDYCKDIARQLIENQPGRDINVIMGGGRQCLQSNVNETVNDRIDRWSCYSTDGRDLIRDWIIDKNRRNLTNIVIKNREELENFDTTNQYVLGIFANGHLNYNYQRPQNMPTLTNMTIKAIEVLQRNRNGYLLVVEGGLIDFAHHRGHARIALDETVAFSDAIEATMKMIDFNDTLIIVTSDHSHSLVMSGYPSRQNNIFEAAQKSKIDGTPYTTLLYSTGGPNNYQYQIIDGRVTRQNPLMNQTDDFEYSQQAVVLTDEVTHSGTDVLVYAKGPMAHLFHSVHEQTFVAYVIGYAAKIGPFQHASGNLSNFLVDGLQIYLIVISIIVQICLQ